MPIPILNVSVDKKTGVSQASTAVNVTTDRFVWPYIPALYDWKDGPYFDVGEQVVTDDEDFVGEFEKKIQIVIFFKFLQYF